MGIASFVHCELLPTYVVPKSTTTLEFPLSHRVCHVMGGDGNGSRHTKHHCGLHFVCLTEAPHLHFLQAGQELTHNLHLPIRTNCARKFGRICPILHYECCFLCFGRPAVFGLGPRPRGGRPRRGGRRPRRRGRPILGLCSFHYITASSSPFNYAPRRREDRRRHRRSQRHRQQRDKRRRCPPSIW